MNIYSMILILSTFHDVPLCFYEKRDMNIHLSMMWKRLAARRSFRFRVYKKHNKKARKLF